MTKYVVKLTMDQAKILGIVKCANCGFPPNHHWDGGKSVRAKCGLSACAHAPCPIYEPGFTIGTQIS